MTGTRHSLALIAGAFALMCAGAAQSQDFLGQGRTPAQIYASDCAICHKSPRGLSGAGGLFGLESFLRAHYTASRESAAALANYLRLVDRGPAPAERRRAVRPSPRQAPAAKDAAGEKKPASMGADSKPGDADQKPADDKAPGTSAAVPSSGGEKPESKPAEAKPSEAKSSEAKSSEAKSAEPTSSEPKLAEPKPPESEPPVSKP